MVEQEKGHPPKEDSQIEAWGVGMAASMEGWAEVFGSGWG